LTAAWGEACFRTRQVRPDSTPSITAAIESIEADGDRIKIGEAMGERHKVRSFYNDMLAPFLTTATMATTAQMKILSPLLIGNLPPKTALRA
jgi:hypothetical protein